MRLLPPPPPGTRLLAVLLAQLVLAACGPRGDDVKGRLLDAPPGARAHVVLEGTPREMGVAQGRLLRARIHAFHEAWQKALLARDGNLLSPATKERRRELMALLEPARRTLPEAALQELEGLAEGCGLPTSTLLLSEMTTDLLRFANEPGPLVQGTLERSAQALAGLRLEGPLAPLLREHLVWVTRPGVGEAARVTLLAPPGALGGLLAVRSDGLALLAVEEPLEAGRQGLAGVPFDLSLRLAAERATGPEQALGLLSKTTAHRVLACDLEGGACFDALIALAGEEPVVQPPTPAASGRTQFGAAYDDAAMWLVEQTGEVSARSRAP
jgi:hypothetical protein